jgi:hypothetical protein
MYANPYNENIRNKLYNLDKKKISHEMQAMQQPLIANLRVNTKSKGGNMIGNSGDTFLSLGYDKLSSKNPSVVVGRGKPVITYKKSKKREELLGCGMSGGFLGGLSMDDVLSKFTPKFGLPTKTPLENFMTLSQDPQVQEIVPKMIGLGKKGKMKGGIPNITEFAAPMTMLNPVGLAASALGTKSVPGKIANVIAQPWSLLGLGKSGGRKGLYKKKRGRPAKGTSNVSISSMNLVPHTATKGGVKISSNNLIPDGQPAQMEGGADCNCDMSERKVGGVNPFAIMAAPFTGGLSLLGAGESGGKKKRGRPKKMKGGVDPFALLAAPFTGGLSLLGAGESGGKKKRGRPAKMKGGVMIDSKNLTPTEQMKWSNMAGGAIDFSKFDKFANVVGNIAGLTKDLMPDQDSRDTASRLYNSVKLMNPSFGSYGFGKKAKKPRAKTNYQQLLDKVRKEKGLSLKDAMKHIKSNNLY